MRVDLTITDRQQLERAVEHQELLVSDALACGLTTLYQRRRDRLRQLRDALADLDAQTGRTNERSTDVLPA